MAKNPIKSKIDDNFWNTWDDGTTMISAYSKFFDGEGTGVIRDSASGYGYRGYGGNRGGYGHTGYEAIQPGHDVRPEFTRDDYDYFRPGEAVPQYEVQRIIDCNRVYNTVGIIKQMIDLMSEFCSKGITPNHKNPRIQKILRAWFAKVNGPERSERFINIFYRLGTTIAKRLNKNLSRIELEGLRKSLLLPDDEFDQDDTPSLAPIQNGFASIPCRYTFLNPICVEHEDHELAPLLPRPQLRVRLRPTLVKKIEEQGGEKLDVRAGFKFAWIYREWDQFGEIEGYVIYYIKNNYQFLIQVQFDPFTAVLRGVSSNDISHLLNSHNMFNIEFWNKVWKNKLGDQCGL